VVAVATPDAFVTAVLILVPAAKVPLAPLLGAVNVTVNALIATLAASSTVTERGVGKAVLTATL
jgi:hypothetical protein